MNEVIYGQFTKPGDQPTLFPEQPEIVNVQAEQWLLGMLLIKPQFLAELPSSFDASHYGDLLHSEIHNVLVEVGKPGQPALVAVIQAIALSDEKTRAYITGLMSTPVAVLPGSAAGYAEAITSAYRFRMLARAVNSTRDNLHTPTKNGSPDGLIAGLMADLEQIIGQSGICRGTITLNQAMDSALRKADEAASRGGPAGLSTGFPSVDAKLGGMDDGNLVVLAGRPGSGKTAAGLQIALHNARQGIGVLVISQEMSAAELGRRALCAIAEVPVHALKQGRHGSYASRLIEARKVLNGLPMSIEDGGGLRASAIAMKARTAHRTHGLGLVMVDHLHITPPEDAQAKHGPTYGVGQVSGAMKRLAKSMNIPVLLLAQLNRGVENREDKRPGLADLRQSGDIEADADAVGFLYRAEMYMLHEPEKQSTETLEKFSNRLSEWRRAKSDCTGKAELILAKVRDGEIGTVPLAFHGETTSFSEVGYDN